MKGPHSLHFPNQEPSHVPKFLISSKYNERLSLNTICFGPYWSSSDHYIVICSFGCTNLAKWGSHSSLSSQARPIRPATKFPSSSKCNKLKVCHQTNCVSRIKGAIQGKIDTKELAFELRRKHSWEMLLHLIHPNQVLKRSPKIYQCRKFRNGSQMRFDKPSLNISIVRF
jgi:hypothetical protein